MGETEEGDKGGEEKKERQDERKKAIAQKFIFNRRQIQSAAPLSPPKAAGLFSRCHSSRAPQPPLPFPCIPAPSNDTFGYCRDETAESRAASLTRIIIFFPPPAPAPPARPPQTHPTSLQQANHKRRGGVSMVLLRKHKGIITHIISGAGTLRGVHRRYGGLAPGFAWNQRRGRGDPGAAGRRRCMSESVTD